MFQCGRVLIHLQLHSVEGRFSYQNKMSIVHNSIILIYILFSECSIDSKILLNDKYLLDHFHRFLAPAVGGDCQWLLCYRPSSDYWGAMSFHNGCDGKNNTVTIIQNGVYVFGGYTDIPWGKIMGQQFSVYASFRFCFHFS